MKGGSVKGYPLFLMRKTLSKKLYMRNITADQIKTIIDWLFGSAILGTFTAREMAAKERTPSISTLVKKSISGERLNVTYT